MNCLKLVAAIVVAAGQFAGATPGSASECIGNPDALGTSRVIRVRPSELPRVGRRDYPETLPLDDHEIVLTFDDGPMAGTTRRVLDALRRECVKATFFVLGRMVKARPDLVRAEAAEGHTIGTHSQSHPLLSKLPLAAGQREIEAGIAATAAALGHAPAPFFRAPYLELPAGLQAYARSRDLMVWSIDFHAGDWEHVTPDQIVARTMARLDHLGRGILLLHDIHERTARALPKLLRELKRGNYRVVHVVPAAR